MRTVILATEGPNSGEFGYELVNSATTWVVSPATSVPRPRERSD